MKKIFILFSISLSFCLIQSQTIEFADQNFKNKLLQAYYYNEIASNQSPVYTVTGNISYPVSVNISGFNSVDTNGDGEIQLSEAEQVKYLDFSYSNISDLSGIEYFTNLEFIDVTYTPIGSLDLSSNLNMTGIVALGSLGELVITGLTNLEYIRCDYSGISSIDTTNLSNLLYLNCNHTGFSSLDLSNMPNLKVLQCTHSLLPSIDVSNFTNLVMLDCSVGYFLSNLNISGCTSLKQLFAKGLKITNLDASNLLSLEKIDASENSFLTDINVEGCNNLQYLDLTAGTFTSNSVLTNLDVSGLSNLEKLFCKFNILTSLNVQGCTSLNELDCSNNYLSDLDVSTCTSLSNLKCAYNGLHSLNIKNTDFSLYSPLAFGGNPDLFSICCDIEDYARIESKVNNYYYSYTIINTGDNCEPPIKYIIESKFDADNNGCDENDEMITNFIVNLSSENQNTDFHFNNNTVSYVFTLDSVATITPINEYQYYSITPETVDVVHEEGQPIQTLEFCLSPLGEINDLEIALIPIGVARPGFEADYKIIFKNRGITTLSGSVILTFQDDYMDFVSSTPTISTQLPNNLSWSFSNLLPFEQRVIFYSMQLNTPTDANFPLDSGDILSFHAIVNPIENDETPIDNIATIRQEVTNSSDPNDKILLEGESITPEMVGEYVNYRIRFENVGTAEAVNIRVEDTIDPAKFDISTLKVVDASHEVRTTVEDNLVKFNFYNIDLPFDDANNDGYVVFKIKTLESLQLNDTFSNQADIYFDYNAPIVTNEYTTTIENLGVEDIENDNLFTLYPNPAKDFFKIESREEIKKIELYDADGRILKTYLGNQNAYDISDLGEGVYLVKIFTDNNSNLQKLMKK